MCVKGICVLYNQFSLCPQGWSDVEAEEDTHLVAGNLHRYPCYHQTLSSNTSKISIFKLW